MPDNTPTAFQDQIVEILPRLFIQSLALTRNRAAAEDLAQDAASSALAAHASFIPESNFSAWMHTIVRNRFISNLRKVRDTTDIDAAPAETLASEAPQEDRLTLNELAGAISCLPADQHEVLMMVVVQGMSYKEIADVTGCAIGTVKSRVFRARRHLEGWLTGKSLDNADHDADQSSS